MNPDIILHAHNLAASATLLAKQRPHPVSTVDPIAVEKALATLPEQARAGRLRDPDAASFLFAAWDPQSTPHHHLYAAVRAELEKIGLGVDVATERWGHDEVPRALFVDYDSLAALADKIRFHRDDWLVGARAEWAARFGDAASVEKEGTAYGDIVVFLGPVWSPEDAAAWSEPGTPPNTRPAYRTGTTWHAEEFGSHVVLALAEMKVPVWTHDAVNKLWAAMAPGGDVVRSVGLWKNEGMRPIPTLIFRRGDVERTYAVEDIYPLTSAALVEKVRVEGGAAWGELVDPGKGSGHKGGKNEARGR